MTEVGVLFDGFTVVPELGFRMYFDTLLADIGFGMALIEYGVLACNKSLVLLWQNEDLVSTSLLMLDVLFESFTKDIDRYFIIGPFSSLL